MRTQANMHPALEFATRAPGALIGILTLQEKLEERRKRKHRERGGRKHKRGQRSRNTVESTDDEENPRAQSLAEFKQSERESQSLNNHLQELFAQGFDSIFVHRNHPYHVIAAQHPGDFDVKRARGGVLIALKGSPFTQIAVPNPAPREWDDEWDADLEIAAKEGDKWLRGELGRGKVKPFRVSWFAPRAQRRVFFPEAVPAHTGAEAIKQVKASIGASDRQLKKLGQAPVNFHAEQMPMEHLNPSKGFGVLVAQVAPYTHETVKPGEYKVTVYRLRAGKRYFSAATVHKDKAAALAYVKKKGLTIESENPKDIAAKFLQLGGKLERALQAKNFDRAMQIEKEIDELAATEEAAEIHYPFLIVRGRNIVRKARKMSELHNPQNNPGQSAYSVAASKGYPYIRGEGKLAKNGYTWLSRFTRDAAGTSEGLYIGYDNKKRRWLIEHEDMRAKNPSRGKRVQCECSDPGCPVHEGKFKDNPTRRLPDYNVYVTEPDLGGKPVTFLVGHWSRSPLTKGAVLAEAKMLYKSQRRINSLPTRLKWKVLVNSKLRNPTFDVDVIPTVRRQSLTVKALTHGGAVRKAKKQVGKKVAGVSQIKVTRTNPRNKIGRNYAKALTEAESAGVDFETDFHAQNIGQLMSEMAKRYGYRAPKGSSGSAGQYFFYLLAREYQKREYPQRNGAPSRIDELAQMFHGRVTGATIGVPVSEHHKHNKDIQRIGRLPYIKMHNRPQGDAHASPKHACNACAIFFPRSTSWVSMNGNKRLILAGNGVLSVGQRLRKMAEAENPGMRGSEINLGRVEVMAYITPEKHSNSGTPILYYHPHAEESGRARDMPTLHIDRNGMLFIPERSGRYNIDERGIIN